jgi:uncharacterized protein (DUF433 family)
MTVQWQDRLVSRPDILRGKPCIRNTRIPVSLVLGYPAAGATVDEIIAEFPDLVADDIAACLKVGGSRFPD